MTGSPCLILAVTAIQLKGEDHPDTLTSASNLANDLRALGEVQAARDLDQDTLDRKRRVLGEDHPDTLTSANNLAADLAPRAKRTIILESCHSLAWHRIRDRRQGPANGCRVHSRAKRR